MILRIDKLVPSPALSQPNPPLNNCIYFFFNMRQKIRDSRKVVFNMSHSRGKCRFINLHEFSLLDF